MTQQPDTTALDGYLEAAAADFRTYFSGIDAQVAGAEMKDLEVPAAIFRVDGIGDSELQDHAQVTFALDFFWGGAGGYRVAHQIWSWVYRRFLFHTAPAMDPAEFEPETGALRFTYRWQRLFKNDYDFHPLEVNGFMVRNVHIHVETI